MERAPVGLGDPAPISDPRLLPNLISSSLQRLPFRMVWEGEVRLDGVVALVADLSEHDFRLGMSCDG